MHIIKFMIFFMLNFILDLAEKPNKA